MRAIVLGSGGATGVPMIGRGWGDCDPANPKNRRRRPALLVEHEATTILIDTPPDLREQLLDANLSRLDAILFTHAHADHLHGVDDIRDVNRLMGGWIDAYADPVTLDMIKSRFGYVFEPQHPSAKLIYKPLLRPHVIEGPFRAGQIDVVPFEQDHGWSKTLGFRFGRLGYSTDLVKLNDEGFAALAGVHTWIVSATVDFPHDTHAELDIVLGWIQRLKPERAVLTHMSTHMDYETLRKSLPKGVEPAYDGMVIDVPA
jgi:phosphoribosyl 1,2-cyclic phosphate phosphodiesterase